MKNRPINNHPGVPGVDRIWDFQRYSHFSELKKSHVHHIIVWVKHVHKQSPQITINFNIHKWVL